MRLQEPTVEGLIKSQNMNKVLAYTPEFKIWIKENPGVLSTVSGIIRQIENTVPLHEMFEVFNNTTLDGTEQESKYRAYLNTTVETKGVKVILVTVGGSVCYKIEYKGEAFFLKKEEDSGDGLNDYGGVHELQSSAEAKALLQKIPNVEAIDFKLGFEETDSITRNKVKYFVSRWVSGVVSLDDYKNRASKEEREYLERIVEEVENILKSQQEEKGVKPFYDELKFNMFYNPLTRKVILFDLNRDI